jgi:hypothetical protein
MQSIRAVELETSLASCPVTQDGPTLSHDLLPANLNSIVVLRVAGASPR